MPEVHRLGSGTESPRALAVGVGGAGCNILRLVPPVPGLDTMAVNEMPQPSMTGFRRKLFLEKTGLRESAARDDRIARSLVTTSEQAIALELGDADLVLLFAGLGGEMGSWGASLVARVASMKGATVLAVATTPFSVEGVGRRQLAQDGLALLRRRAHGVLTMPNDSLLRVAPHLPLLKAFDVMSRLAVRPVIDLLRVIRAGDLPALKDLLRRAEDWRLGVGVGRADHPELTAVEAAFESPWIHRNPSGARAIVLLATFPEADEARAKAIVHDADLRTPSADLLWGTCVDPSSEGIRVTVLVGF